MRKRSFEYKENQILPLLVPKGYKKSDMRIDSVGNKVNVFSYSNGGLLYFAYGNTTKDYQAIDTSMNIVKYYPQDVLFYKGQDKSTRLFWRESRYKNFRFGYSNISVEAESAFDSSVNYAGWQIFIKDN